ncbi:MAG: hypothetical protein HKO85_00120 [Xanthomonadales bacterium]|nr:hypothetical protein [Xanthomonadales bacterium]
MNTSKQAMPGISLLEVIIAFAITSILVAVSMPNFKDYTARARVSEALQQAIPAQNALVRTCMENNRAVVSENRDAGYTYRPSLPERDFIDRVELNADCARKRLSVTVWTFNTGASPNPIIEWSAKIPKGVTAEVFEPPYYWTCRVIRGDFAHLPPECRKRYRKS